METNEVLVRKTDSDATAEVLSALSKTEKGKNNIIKFENGVYHFRRENAFYGYFCPVYNPNGYKYVHFPLINKENVTIDGNGAVFMFEDRVYPFITQCSSNITYKNFTVDFSFARYAYVTVTEATDEGFTLKIAQNDLTYSVEDDHNLTFISGSDRICTGEKRFFLQNLTRQANCYLLAGDTTDPLINPATILVFTDAYDKGEKTIHFKYRSESNHFDCRVGDTAVLSFDENRENSVFYLEDSKNISFENVTVLRGAGFGILATLTENIHIDGCSFSIPEERKSTEIISVTADLIHFMHCSGTVLIENSVFEDCLDDAVNIHGQYMRIKKLLSENSAEVEFCHQSHACRTLYKKGDFLTVSDSETMLEKGSVTVISESQICDGGNLSVTFSENINGVLSPGDYLENPSRMPVIIFRNNSVSRCPHIRISSSKYMEVSHNYLNLGGTGVYIADLFSYWFESGRVHSVLIEKNRFEDSTVHGTAAGIEITSSRPGGYRHENITIRDNTFKMQKSFAIYAENVDNLTLKNNDLGGADEIIKNCSLK